MIVTRVGNQGSIDLSRTGCHLGPRFASDPCTSGNIFQRIYQDRRVFDADLDAGPRKALHPYELVKTFAGLVFAHDFP
jgi:hypothetical protein